MKFSLPFRIFAAHLVFMLAVGALGTWMVRRAYERHRNAWEEKVVVLPAEQLFNPLASEVARSLLRQLEVGPTEPREAHKASVSQALNRVVSALPSIEHLAIVDEENRLQFASDAVALELTLTEDPYASAFQHNLPNRRQIRMPSGDELTEVLLPVTEPGETDDAGERRLGTVLFHYRPDPAPAESPAETEPPSDELPEVDAERVFRPLALEIARGLLRDLNKDVEELQDEYKVSVSQGLDKVLDALPIESLIIVDDSRRIQYVNDPQYLDLTFADEDKAALFASETTVRRDSRLDSGERGVETMVPVYDTVDPEDPAGEQQRIGSVLIRYRPDPILPERIPALSPPGFAPYYLEPLLVFLVLAVGGGVILALVTGIPVQRLERALKDFRARGYRGGLDASQTGLPKVLQSTVETIQELGGKLEHMDSEGRERENLLATLSQSLEDGMVALDPRGVPVAWNPAAMRILTAREAEPEAGGAKTGSDEEARLLQEALSRNPDLQFVADLDAASGTREVDILRPDGSQAAARLTHVAFEVRPGETGTLLLIRDLAALRRVESHLLEAGRFAVLANLSASLAHEIRNPLHSIQLNASVIGEYIDQAESTQSGKVVADSVGTVKDEAQRLADLLNNYLGLVKTGQEVGPVDLGEISRKVIQLVDYAAHKSKVEIRLVEEDDLPQIPGIANRLQQAVLNLVLNAIQAMPDGGRVTLTTTSSPGVARLTVSDTGPGLSQELADQLFDTRVTTKEGGTGLGLPLVRVIAQSHGGGVWYRSTPGKGASFTMVLPTHPG